MTKGLINLKRILFSVFAAFATLLLIVLSLPRFDDAQQVQACGVYQDGGDHGNNNGNDHGNNNGNDHGNKMVMTMATITAIAMATMVAKISSITSFIKMLKRTCGMAGWCPE
jgi:hypothetical protein